MSNILSRGEQGSESYRSPAQREWGPGGLFGDFFGMEPFRGLFSALAPLTTLGGIAGVEVRRTEDGYQAEIPVPGLSADQIEVTYQGNVLTISGTGEKRRLWRSIVLPEEIDPESVTAQVEHGLLTLSMRLPPEAQPKRIQVRQLEAGEQPVTTGRFPRQGAETTQTGQQSSEATGGSQRGNR